MRLLYKAYLFKRKREREGKEYSSYENKWLSAYPGENGDNNSSFRQGWWEVKWDDSQRTLSTVLVLNNSVTSTQPCDHHLNVASISGDQLLNSESTDSPSVDREAENLDLILQHVTQPSWVCHSMSYHPLVEAIIISCQVTVTTSHLVSLLPLQSQHSSFSNGARVTSWEHKSNYVSPLLKNFQQLPMSHGLNSSPRPKMPRWFSPCLPIWNHVYHCASGLCGSHYISLFVVSLLSQSLSLFLLVWNVLFADLHMVYWFRAQLHSHLLRVACAYSSQPSASLHPLTLLDFFRTHEYLKAHSLCICLLSASSTRWRPECGLIYYYIPRSRNRAIVGANKYSWNDQRRWKPSLLILLHARTTRWYHVLIPYKSHWEKAWDLWYLYVK